MIRTGRVTRGRSDTFVLELKQIICSQVLIFSITPVLNPDLLMKPLSSCFCNPVAEYPDHYCGIIILLVFIKNNIINICSHNKSSYPCLLYTSDAADEEDSVDLGGRRIIKKKK